MRNALGLAAAGFLAACAVEEPPRVSAETIEAAVEHAHLQAERVTARASRAADESP